MSRSHEIYRGVVFPWQCDHIGHMNVRWYSHHFDDAGFHLWSVIGLSQREMREKGTQVVVAQTTIKYVREMKAGDLILIKAGITKVGNKSVVHFAKMLNADTGTLHATEETVEVFFDPAARSAVPMPEDFRKRLLPHVIEADKI